MSDFENQVSVSINGKRFSKWSEIRISSAIDNLSTVEISGPFDPKDQQQRNSLKPFAFNPMSVSVNDEVLFTGTIRPIVPRLEPAKNIVTVGAYSLPGVLGDCTMPITSLPLEFKKRNLHEIAGALLKPFDLNYKADSEPGPVFDKIAINPESKVLEFLAERAKERSQVISNTPDGRLLFRQAITSGKPVVELKQGLSPLTNVDAEFNFSNYYSEITGIQPVRVRAKKTNNYTKKNSLLADAVRPYVYNVPNSKDANLEASVSFKLGTMFANMVTYEVEVATWRDPNGKLWEPNTIVKLESPGVMIYKPFDFVIRTVTLAKNANSETAQLGIVLPNSFTNEIPGGFPWDE